MKKRKYQNEMEPIFVQNNKYAEKHMTKIHQIDIQKNNRDLVKFIYSEKATKFCEVSTLLLNGTK